MEICIYLEEYPLQILTSKILLWREVRGLDTTKTADLPMNFAKKNVYINLIPFIAFGNDGTHIVLSL